MYQIVNPFSAHGIPCCSASNHQDALNYAASYADSLGHDMEIHGPEGIETVEPIEAMPEEIRRVAGTRRMAD
jgi:hypothetical protein